jgi:hypothetical protein
MDARSENLFRDRSNAINLNLAQKIQVGWKNKTFYSKRGNYVHSGTRQQNA